MSSDLQVWTAHIVGHVLQDPTHGLVVDLTFHECIALQFRLFLLCQSFLFLDIEVQLTERLLGSVAGWKISAASAFPEFSVFPAYPTFPFCFIILAMSVCVALRLLMAASIRPIR